MGTEYDVIIVGAGISGLASAASLVSHGHSVLVLEARDRLGGRIHGVSIGGSKVDVGASFIHGRYDNPITKLAADLDLSLYEEDEEAIPLMFDDAGQLREEDVAIVAGTIMRAFFHDSKEYSAHADPTKLTSLGDFINSAIQLDEPNRSRALQLSRAFCGWTGAELENVSMRWWGFERETMGPDKLVMGGQYSRVIGHLATGVDVRLEHEVSAITRKAEGIAVTAGGMTFHAVHVVCTLPLGVLKHTNLFSPPLPPRKLAAIRNLGFGLLSKVVLRYETAWWRNKTGYSMMFLLSEKPPGCDESHAIAVQDFHHVSKEPLLCVLLGASFGEAVEKCDAVNWADGAIRRSLGGDAKLVEGYVTSWRADPHSRGSYTYIPPDTTPLELAEFQVPIWEGSLGFAGEHTHQNRYASVHGAYESGLREAKRVHIALEMQ